MGPPPCNNRHQNGHSLTLTLNNICASDTNTNSVSHNHSHIALTSTNTSDFKGVSSAPVIAAQLSQSQFYRLEQGPCQEVSLQIRGASTKLFNRRQFQFQIATGTEKESASEIQKSARNQRQEYWDPFARLSKSGRHHNSGNSLKLLWEAFQPELNTGYSYKCVTRSNKCYLRLLRVDLNLQNSDQISETKERKVRKYKSNLITRKKVKLLTSQTEVETL